MHFDFSKLRGKIIEKYGSMGALAKDIGITNVVFSAKMTGRVRFTSDDIIKIVELLDIPQEEIGVYFFTLKV